MIKVFIFLLFSFTSMVCGQTSNLSSKTDLPSNAIFEIIQSSLAARWTFKIDRFTGRIWQYVRTKDDDNVWEEMLVLPKPTSSTRPKFQIFLSGIAAKFTFLIDNDNGKTWVLTTSKDKNGDELTYWNQLSE